MSQQNGSLPQTVDTQGSQPSSRGEPCEHGEWAQSLVHADMVRLVSVASEIDGYIEVAKICAAREGGFSMSVELAQRWQIVAIGLDLKHLPHRGNIPL